VRRFLTPTMLGAHLLALVCVGSAGWLGYWQLDAWQEQRRAESVDLTRLDPEPLESVMGPDDRFPGDKVGQPVIVAGTWVGDGTVYVSGRRYEGAEGYWVVTPLAVGGADDPALPVVRGWTPSPDEAPAPPTGTAELVGWLQPTEGTGQSDDDPGDDVLPQVRTADLIQHVDQDLYGAYAVLDPARTTDVPASAGLESATLEQLPEVGRFTALRNLLYAIEWWFFGAFAAFIWWRYVSEQTQEDDVEEHPADSSLVGP
jgi:surfeit locus 1 family protein